MKGGSNNITQKQMEENNDKALADKIAAKKEVKPLTAADRAWINKTFTKQQQEICELVWGGVPLYDEAFVRNSDLFKKQLNRPQERS